MGNKGFQIYDSEVEGYLMYCSYSIFRLTVLMLLVIYRITSLFVWHEDGVSWCQSIQDTPSPSFLYFLQLVFFLCECNVLFSKVFISSSLSATVSIHAPLLLFFCELKRMPRRRGRIFKASEITYGRNNKKEKEDESKAHEMSVELNCKMDMKIGFKATSCGCKWLLLSSSDSLTLSMCLST